MKFKDLLLYLSDGIRVELYVNEDPRLTADIESVRSIANNLIEIGELTVKEKGVSFREVSIGYAGIYGRKVVRVNCYSYKE